MKKFTTLLSFLVCALVVVCSANIVIAEDNNGSDGTAGQIEGSTGIPADSPVNNVKNAKEKLEQARELLKERASQQLDKIKKLRDNAQENMKERVQKAKEKIDQVKDARKKEAANKIIEQLKHTNQVWTDHFTNVLNQLDAVLQKIQTRTDKAVANGKDMSVVNTAITSAKTAVEAARTAVAIQAAKIYAVDTTLIVATSPTSTTNEQNQLLRGLRDQFKIQKDQLKTDLNNIRDGVVKDARTSVHNIVQTLSDIPDINNEPEDNSSAGNN